MILLAAILALAAGPVLPPSLAGLKTLGPYAVLLLGTGMGAWFNRGRAFIALASLLGAFAGYSFALQFGADSFAARAVFTAAAIFVPLNFLLAAVYPERGISHHFNYRWLMLAAAETLFTAWIASAGHSNLSGMVWQDLLNNWLLRSPPTPLLGRLLFAAALVAAVARAWPKIPAAEIRPLDIGQGQRCLAHRDAGDPRLITSAGLIARAAAPGTLFSVEGARVNSANAGGD